MDGMLSIKPPINSLGKAISSKSCGACLKILKKNMRSSVGSDMMRSIYLSKGISAAEELIGFDGSAFELSYSGTTLLPTALFRYSGVHFSRAAQLLVKPFITSGRRGFK